MERLIAAMAIVAVTAVCDAQNSVQVVAHRGFWNTPGSAQNSIAALVKADSIGVYGSEFDVWLTADNKLVVNHDDAVGGFVIERSKAADVTAQRLPNGENVPTLEQYLDAAQTLQTRLVFELKPHADKKHELRAVKLLLKMMKRKGLTDRVDYITFSRNAFEALLKSVPEGTPVYYLNGEITPDELKQMGAAGMDYELAVLREHPEWIKRCHELGMKVNVWTVNSTEDLAWCISQGVDFITTNEPVRLQQMTK